MFYKRIADTTEHAGSKFFARVSPSPAAWLRVPKEADQTFIRPFFCCPGVLDDSEKIRFGVRQSVHNPELFKNSAAPLKKPATRFLAAHCHTACCNLFVKISMLTFFYSIFDDRDHNVRQKTIALYAFLLAANVGAWLWAWLVLQDHPFLLASAVLAYTLGLRHAVDADHIAGIDNVSRKLMQEGKRPLTAGFFFSLGHSSIVTLMSVAVCFAAVSLQTHFEDMKSIGTLISTSVSAFYLFLLALLNLTVLIAVCRTFAAVQRGEALRENDLDVLLNQRGLVARWFRPLFRITTRSWHMYPMGFLFGLGFDTATEVALFGISAAQAVKGMSLWTIMVFPALFTAGMSLVDTADGTLMQGAYGWAFAKPIRKLYYNITITLVSVLVASGIAGIETLGLLRERYAMTGAFWDGVGALNAHFGLLGYGIIGVFIGCWLISFLVYKFKRYDTIEVRFQ